MVVHLLQQEQFKISWLQTTGTEEKAVCKLTNDKGEWTLNNTPGSVSVKRSYADLLVVCTKDKKSGTQKVHSQTKGMLAGNILCGGIGIIGGGIDCASGAAYDYPSTIDVFLK